MIKIKENDRCVLWRYQSTTQGEFFEVWIKIVGNYGKFKGQNLIPSDEDFGVWAWTAYSLETAEKIFNEITSGERNITPMTEI